MPTHWDEACDRAVPVGDLDLRTSLDGSQVPGELALELRDLDALHDQKRPYETWFVKSGVDPQARSSIG